MSARGLIVAAARSGAGKTTVRRLAALVRRGVGARAAKSGPDYLDPAFHAAATGPPSLNLDSWAMPRALIDALAGTAAQAADLFVIEGAMGLFDGVPVAGRTGVAADLAARFGLPVLLVLDVAGQSQSAAAVARGFAVHDPAVRIGGVILNRVGSERHRTLVADALTAIGLRVVGAIPRDATLVLPERHLGRVQAGEHADLSARLAHLATAAERHLDLTAIIDLAVPLHAAMATAGPALPPPGQWIALACDDAFSFVYAHVVDGWRQAGAGVVRFSPLADEPPPDTCDVCWLPGGYPELHAARRAAADPRRAAGP